MITLRATARGQDPDAPPALYYFYLKGKKARWDLFGEGGTAAPVGYRIYDGETRKFYTKMRQPIVYVTDESALTSRAGPLRDWKFSPFKLEPHGQVQGVPCLRQTTQDDEYEYDACLASGFPTIPLPLLGEALAEAVPFNAAVQRKGLFPLSVAIHALKHTPGAGGRALPGPPMGGLKVLEVNRGEVPSDAFAVPPFPTTETPTLIAPGLLR
jgi:hypothetical protein